MQKWLQPPACSDHSLHRILSSYWLAHFHLMKKSAKVQLYFGSDCGMMGFFTDEPQSKEQLIPNWCLSRIFVTRFGEKDRGLSTCKPWTEQAGGLEAFFSWSGSELWSCFKYSELKLKNYKHIAVDVLFKAYPLVALSCRSNLAGRFL